MGEGDQKRVEGVQVTAKSPIQAIKQQKGFLKNTAARPSPSGKPNSRPGSAGSQYKREGSPSVLQAGIVKNEYNPSTSKPTSRLFAKAIQESVRPPSRPTSAAAADPPPAREEPPAPAAVKPEHQDQVKHEDFHTENGKRRPSPSRSRSRSRSPDNGKRHKKQDEKDRHNSSSPEYSRPPSPRNPADSIQPSGRDSAEEGEWRGQRVEERDNRGGGDRYREKRRSRSPSRSRSRDRRHRDRHGGSYRDRKYRGRDKDDRGYDRHRRGRSTSRERRRRRYTPSRSRSRSKDEYEDHRRGRQGGGGGDRGGGYDDHRRRGYEERDRRAGGGGGERGGGRRSPSRERQDRKKPVDLRGPITVAATAGGGASGVLVGHQQPQQYAPPQVQQPTQLPPYYQGQPPLPPLQQPQQHIPMTSIYQQHPPYQHHQYPYQQQHAHGGAQRPPTFPLSRPPQIAPPPPLAPPPPPLEQEQPARSEPFEENVYPPLGPPPPSPDVSKYLIEMTSAYNEEFSPTRGLVDPEKFCTALLYNNTFREKESHIWAAQQAQQEMLLAILDGYDPDPFDEVSERLGLRQPLPPHRVPPHAIQIEVDKWAARQKVSALPFEALNPTEPPPDPRQLLPAEYKAVKEWARRPLRVPPMKIRQRPEDEAAAGDGGDDKKNVVLKSSVSWSQSPSRDYGGEPEVATIKKEIKNEPSQPPPGSGLLGPGSRRPSSAAVATGSRFDDVLNAPSAPRHDASYLHSATRSIQRPGAAGGSGSASLLKMQQPMDLDEGRFQINLPDGSVPETKQYSQLLEYVSRDKPVPEGKVPPGWPVYREEDQLWVPLKDLSMSLDDFEVTRVKDAVVPNIAGAQVIAALWDASRDDLKKERKSTNMDFFTTFDEEGRKEINAAGAGGFGQFYRVQNNVVIGGEERAKECDIVEKEEPSSAAIFKKADVSAARAVAEALEKRKLERKKGPISTYAAPAHAVAAVHGALLANRDTIKIAATSVLQHALKIVIEQQQAEKKLKVSSEKTK